MGLLDLLVNKEDKSKKKNESLLDLLGLNNSQKEEIKKGNYNTWNFDEEDLEEDDYYFEDDE